MGSVIEKGSVYIFVPYQNPSKGGSQLVNANEIQDFEKCRRCGGTCCRIYADENRNPDVYFEDLVVNFHHEFYENPEFYGVKPNFDPLIVHKNGNEHMIKELADKGIDAFACQFLGPQGCSISWEKRPALCKSYKCPEWDLK
jgi:Fe-S-cluster containining protein